MKKEIAVMPGTNERHQQHVQKRRKIKNAILNAITVAAFSVTLIGICGIDSNMPIASGMIVAGIAWLVPFGIANNAIY